MAARQLQPSGSASSRSDCPKHGHLLEQPLTGSAGLRPGLPEGTWGQAQKAAMASPGLKSHVVHTGPDYVGSASKRTRHVSDRPKPPANATQLRTNARPVPAVRRGHQCLHCLSLVPRATPSSSAISPKAYTDHHPLSLSRLVLPCMRMRARSIRTVGNEHKSNDGLHRYQVSGEGHLFLSRHTFTGPPVRPDPDGSRG